MTVDFGTLLPWPLIVAFGGALGLSLALTPLVERQARLSGARRGGEPPRLGGIAIALATWVPMAVTLGVATDASAEFSRAVGLASLSLIILGLGIYDDLRGATPFEKLLVQTAVAAATWLIGVRIGRITGLDGNPWALGDALSFAVTVAWIVAITNAVNLIDGLDGLAAGVGLIAVLTFGAFGFLDGHGLVLLVAVALTGALTGFLVYNWSPARIFMGDSGSLFLGYVLAVTAVLSTVKQYTAFAVAVPVLALGVPILDTLMAIVRRLRRGVSVTERDDEHVHHRLVRAGLTERQAVLLLYSLAIGLATVALAIRAATAPMQALAIAVAAVVAFGLVQLLRRGGLPADDPDALSALQDLVRRRAMTRAVRDSGDMEDLWVNTLRALTAQGVVEADLELFTKTPQRWRYGRGLRRSRLVDLTIPLFGDDHTFGVLRVSRRRFRDELHDRQREVQIHVVAEAVIDALDALTPELRREWVVTRLPVRPG